MDYPKIIIGTGTRGNDIYYKLAEWFCEQVRRHNTTTVVFGECSWSAPRAQQLIFDQLIGKEFDWLLLVDADVCPPNDAIDIMLRLGGEYDVIGAPVWMGNTHDIHCNVHYGDGHERVRTGKLSGTERIEHASFACLMLHRRVFDAFAGKKESLVEWSPFLSELHKPKAPDQIFSLKAVQMGFKMAMCWDVRGSIHHRPMQLSDRLIEHCQTMVKIS
jgi:hypothetical protein